MYVCVLSHTETDETPILFNARCMSCSVVFLNEYLPPSNHHCHLRLCISRLWPPAQHPFEGVHWGALLAGLVNETLRVEWPADMDPLLRKTGEACTHIDPARRPVSFILSKVGSGMRGLVIKASEHLSTYRTFNPKIPYIPSLTRVYLSCITVLCFLFLVVAGDGDA